VGCVSGMHVLISECKQGDQGRRRPDEQAHEARAAEVGAACWERDAEVEVRGASGGAVSILLDIAAEGGFKAYGWL
jgi:hypothetical protein